MDKLDDLKITLTNFPDRTSLHDCMYEVQDLGELSVSISIEFFLGLENPTSESSSDYSC